MRKAPGLLGVPPVDASHIVLNVFIAASIATLIAAVLAYIELQSRLRTRLTKRAGWWLLARLALEVIGAIAAVLLLPLAADGWWTEGPAAGFVAGVSVPALLRLRLVALKIGEGELPIGVATAYEPVRNFIERQIDDIGAAEESRWINAVVLPSLVQSGWTPSRLADRVRTYVRGLTRLSEPNRLAALKYVDTTLADPITDENKIRLLVQKVADLGGHRLLEDLLAERR
jgi:hypothetical protein